MVDCPCLASKWPQGAPALKTNKLKTLKLDMILIKRNDERKSLKKSEYDGDKLINCKFFIFWK